MDISRRSLIGGSGTLALAGLLPLQARAADCKPLLTPAEALDRLQEGNRYFATNPGARTYDISRKRRETIARQQTPFAAILCCSDSRAAPEQIFQVGLGEVFVVRNAGTTVANPQALGSLEYAVNNVCVTLIVVLGHSKCGAAEAATAVAGTGAPLPGSLEGMVLPLVPAAVSTRGRTGGTWIDRTTVENVFRVCDYLKAPSQPILYPALQARDRLKIIPAIYDLESGAVDWNPRRSS